MSAKKSNSAAPIERERLLPPWVLLIFLVVVGTGLALIFPRETLRERLLGQGRTLDALAVAYLEAWYRVAPDDADFVEVLAEQYARTGHLEQAEALLARMASRPGGQMAGPVLRIRITIARQRANAAPPGTPARESDMRQLRELLQAATARQWAVAELQQLATVAREAGAQEEAVAFYRALAQKDTAHADYWNRSLATTALASGNYREAAAALFEAQARATSIDQQRSLYLEALRTLQSGNLLDEALVQAERHGGALLDDPEVLRYLTRLALAANRPDIASRYVERLIRPGSQVQVPGETTGAIFLDGQRGLLLRQVLADAGA
ncbi:MAG: hypothetical protein JO067_05520 [Cupriavidus sp.]|nr:hypothetical protein [Cupriavidus sp.]